MGLDLAYKEHNCLYLMFMLLVHVVWVTHSKPDIPSWNTCKNIYKKLSKSI